MKRGAHVILFVTVILILAPIARAQDKPDNAPIVLGDFTLSGSATAGYRFTDVKGYRPQYQEMFDLGNGFRLLDLSLYGDSQDGKNPFADHFSLQTSSLGGDPYPSAQFAVSKDKVYDLRVDWRESYYYWNQNDNVVLPIASATTGISKGLTNNHDWATVRKFGSVDLTLHATNRLRFHFNYDRPSDDGTTFTTRSLDFFSSPSYWGGFARANPYYLDAPLNDSTNRFTGGFDYTLKDWNFHYSIGYQTFTENINLANVGSPELSINPIASSLTEPVTNVSWSQFRRLTTPISEFSFVGKPLPKLEWRGSYMYYRYQGPVTFTQAFNGTAPGSTGTLAPYSVSESANAAVIEPNNIVTQGLTYHLFPWWSLDLNYRYSRFTSDSTGNYQSLLNGTISAAGTTEVIWRDGLSDLDFNMDFTPIHSLLIRPGVQFMRSDVESLANGVINPGDTLRTDTVRPEISFGFEPSKYFSIRGDFHSMDNGSSYTAISPHTEEGTHFVLRVHPIEQLSIEDEINVSNDKLLTTNFQNNIRSNAITVSYALGDRFSIFGGFSYDSYYAQGNILYARGTAPLADTLHDQEVDRVWSGGIEAKPVKRFGLRLSGNFDRSSGVGALSGEPPAYGPLAWPLITGTVYYNLPKAGQVAIDLQRTYYIEQIVTVNNYSANLLTIRWTKAF
ncbi:MAG: MtrB/PioB family outer membrane beta-barrel protein [Candidatus Acidiferrales bacterium]